MITAGCTNHAMEMIERLEAIGIAKYGADSSVRQARAVARHSARGSRDALDPVSVAEASKDLCEFDERLLSRKGQ